jgi:hypothetical protein
MMLLIKYQFAKVNNQMQTIFIILILYLIINKKYNFRKKIFKIKKIYNLFIQFFLQNK